MDIGLVVSGVQELKRWLIFLDMPYHDMDGYAMAGGHGLAQA